MWGCQGASPPRLALDTQGIPGGCGVLRAKYRNLSGLGALAAVGLRERAWVNLGRNWGRGENREDPGKDTVYLGCVERKPRNVCERMMKTEQPLQQGEGDGH